MALWGNNDSVYAVGVVTVSYGDLTVTGSGDFVAGGVAGLCPGQARSHLQRSFLLH